MIKLATKDRTPQHGTGTCSERDTEKKDRAAQLKREKQMCEGGVIQLKNNDNGRMASSKQRDMIQLIQT